MKLLAIETSAETGSVALLSRSLVRERRIEHPREQTELVLPFVQALLEEAALALGDLDAIVFGRGPGSFTGIRVAAAVAQGLATAARLPVLPVSSLAALAQAGWRTQRLERSLACIDARMGEVYWAAFAVQDGVAQPLSDERVGPPDAVEAPLEGPWAAIGSGFAAYPEQLASLRTAAAEVHADLQPTAADLLPQARLDFAAGRGVPPEAARPVYLRDATAWRSRSR